ncbi:MAG: AAA family ATPase [Leptolyngbyaceae cyanobacterium]
MLTKIEIKNYKSICSASIELSPFTLLIGANGTGKSNLISLLKEISKEKPEINKVDLHPQPSYSAIYSQEFEKHFNFLDKKLLIKFQNSIGQKCTLHNKSISGTLSNNRNLILNANISPLPELTDVRIFNIDPAYPGKSETLVAKPTVHENGTGVVQVLDSLKTGDREDLFVAIEHKLGKYIPEIEKLSFMPGKDTKKLQVREQYIPQPVPVEVLSEGTRLVLTILTILHQERPPSLICIEDIDRGLHPRLFQKIIELCRDLSERRDIQIIATTHNPYILDEFPGNESAVVIVEKKEGCTTFTTLSERLAQLEANGSDDEIPLGSLWYSGLVGGVPKR